MLDDAIVVVGVKRGSGSMATAVRVLKEKLGDDAMEELRFVLEDGGQRWRDDVLAIAAERYDRRLAHEIGAFRIDVAKEFAAMRVDVAKEFAAMRAESAGGLAAMRTETASEFAAMRVELAAARVSLLKWSFLFWIGQFAAVSGMMAFLLSTAKL